MEPREPPLFNSPEQAITVSFHMTQRLAMVVSWCLVWLVHLTVAALIALMLWCLDLRAQEALAAIQKLASTTPAAVAVAVGVSVLGLIGGYWKLVQWANRKASGGWLLGYLIQDVRD